MHPLRLSKWLHLASAKLQFSCDVHHARRVRRIERRKEFVGFPLPHCQNSAVWWIGKNFDLKTWFPSVAVRCGAGRCDVTARAAKQTELRSDLAPQEEEGREITARVAKFYAVLWYLGEAGNRCLTGCLSWQLSEEQLRWLLGNDLFMLTNAKVEGILKLLTHQIVSKAILKVIFTSINWKVSKNYRKLKR